MEYNELIVLNGIDYNITQPLHLPIFFLYDKFKRNEDTLSLSSRENGHT